MVYVVANITGFNVINCLAFSHTIPEFQLLYFAKIIVLFSIEATQSGSKSYGIVCFISMYSSANFIKK